ncbi:hypothetical protein HK096_006344 [Nowakowskiella sp. JEL0078]|nr:hypothetical protein HK096_006344 [Nowakowskiella sp. JEL0078]
MKGIDLVTNIRVGIVARESFRRVDERNKVEIWDSKRNEESTKSESMQKEIEAQWEKALKFEGPFQIYDMLTEQKSLCSQLMTIKNKLINEYMTELKCKDDEYVKELKRQAEEIDTLLERMEDQFRTFQNTLREELEQIERSFIEERTEMIESNLKEVQNIFEQRRDSEGKFMEERADRIEDHIKQLESLRVHDAEEYNLVKIKLETDVQVLEQQLQQPILNFVSDESNLSTQYRKIGIQFSERKRMVQYLELKKGKSRD